MEDDKMEINLDVPFEKEISRLFIFRFLWMVLAIWPIMFWSWWVMFISFLQFWHQLILGTRHRGLWNRQLRFFRHLTKWQAYLSMLVDKRPKFIED
jgi:hypothetical protein